MYNPIVIKKYVQIIKNIHTKFENNMYVKSYYYKNKTSLYRKTN